MNKKVGYAHQYLSRTETIIIPNCKETVKKSNFFAVFCCLGIYVDQALDLINGGAALIEEMRGDNISGIADLSFRLYGACGFLFHIVTLSCKYF